MRCNSLENPIGIETVNEDNLLISILLLSLENPIGIETSDDGRIEQERPLQLIGKPIGIETGGQAGSGCRSIHGLQLIGKPDRD